MGAVRVGGIHFGGTDAGAVSALLEQMCLARHARPPQGGQQEKRVLHRNGLILHGMPDEVTLSSKVNTCCAAASSLPASWTKLPRWANSPAVMTG